MRLDPIRALEACYAAEPDERTWARRILEALAPADPGLGLAALARETRADGGRELVVLAEQGSLPDWYPSLRKLYAGAPGRVIPPMLEVPFTGLTSRFLERMGSTVRAEVLGALGRSGVGDTFAIVAPVGSRNVQVHLGIPSARPQPPPRTREQLARLASHLVSAVRLRRALRSPGTSFLDDPLTEAVLEPDGRVRHLAGRAQGRRARGALVEAVRRLDRARGSLRWRAPEEALSLWDDLVEGRWSLVDHVDADGRRFVLARRNPPGPDLRSLRASERTAVALALRGSSNKEIGYELGVSASTAAGHLRTAQAKLGVGSRRELIAILGSLPVARP